MSFDKSYYYRITNTLLGPNRSLEATTTIPEKVRMAVSGDYPEQRWQLSEHVEGSYKLTTPSTGANYALDLGVAPPDEGRAVLTPFDPENGQIWWGLVPSDDGTYRLTNYYHDNRRSKGLTVNRETHIPNLADGDTPGHHWRLTPIEPIEPVAKSDIPELIPRDLPEGTTDFTRYARPIGTVRAVMIFVDFPDVPATGTPRDVADHLLGIETGQSTGKAQALFAAQSYGKMTLDVKVVEEWKRLPSPTASYDLRLGNDSLIKAALALFTPNTYRLHDYDMVLIVPARGSELTLSTAFSSWAGGGFSYGTSEVRLCAVFGANSYTDRYTTVVHEVGHLIGLPDLYGAGGTEWRMGCWSIMSDIFHSVSFVGWHRHKNGWLDPSRKECLRGKNLKRERILKPLSGKDGLSMVVLPIDDEDIPSRVYVIEMAEPVLGTNGKFWGDGVLLYTVDVTIRSGENPLVLVPKTKSTSEEYGYLYEAPYVAGDVATHTDYGAGASIRMEVYEKFNGAYRIGLEYTRT